MRSRDSVAIIATRYEMDDPGFKSEQRQEIFSSPKCPHLPWAQLSFLFKGYTGSYLEVKRLEGDHSPPSIANVKHEWNCTSAPPIFLHGVDRNKFHTYNYM
jgi:hypothetical protein